MPLALVWTVTWLFIVTLVVTPATYTWALMNDPAVERSTSPTADSWGAGLIGGPIVGIILSVFIVRLTKFLTRRYTRPSLLVWRKERLKISVIWTIGFVAITCVVLGLLGADFLNSPPVYEYQILPFYLFGVLWLATLRAAAIGLGDTPVVPHSDAR